MSSADSETAEEIQLTSQALISKAEEWKYYLEKNVSSTLLKRRIQRDIEQMRLSEVRELALYFYTKYLQLENENELNGYMFMCRLLEDSLKDMRDKNWLKYLPNKIHPDVLSYLDSQDHLLNFQGLVRSQELESTYYNYLHRKFRGSYLWNFAQLGLPSCYSISTASRSELLRVHHRIVAFVNRWPPDEMFATRPPLTNNVIRMVEDKEYMYRLLTEGNAEKMREFLEEIYLHKGPDYYGELHSFLQETRKGTLSRSDPKEYKYLDVADEMESYLHRIKGAQSDQTDESEPRTGSKRKRSRVGSPVMSSTPKDRIKGPPAKKKAARR